MSGKTYVGTIRVPFSLNVRGTQFEYQIERELKKRDSRLNSGVIETSSFQDFTRAVHLRRATRPNTQKHNLIYIRDIGFNYVNINELIRGKNPTDPSEEYLCIGTLNPREIFSAASFEKKNGVYEVVFETYDVDTNNRKTEGFFDDAIEVCEKIPGKMWEAPGGTFKHVQARDLKKVTGKLCEAFLRADYAVLVPEDDSLPADASLPPE